MKSPLSSKCRDTAGSADGCLTRAQTAKLLGISKTRVRQLEERGDLRSIKDEQGRCRYDPVEVLALVERREDDGIPSSSELDRLFDMFRERRTVLEIRLATGLSTETIMQLYAEYRTPVDHHYERESEARETRALRERERHLQEVSRPMRRRWREEED
jgi:hypothetical protein